MSNPRAAGSPTIRQLVISTVVMAAVAVGLAMVAAGEHGPGRVWAWISAILCGALSVSFVVLFLTVKRLERRHGSVDPERGPGLPAVSGPGLVFRRDFTYQDALRKYRIKVDGRVVGHLSAGSTLEVDVPAGRHTCQARISWTGSREVEVTVPESDRVEVLVDPAPGDPISKTFSLTKWLVLRPQQEGQPPPDR